MTPTSTLAGLLTGIIDGLLIMMIVLVGVYVAGKWHAHEPATHPVADDLPAPQTHKTLAGELPTAD